ncbi:MAG TPA: redoxin domain-containing protein [Gemmata sp.]|nr:redoxin domain-containing protein [Gemmata sp.]
MTLHRLAITVVLQCAVIIPFATADSEESAPAKNFTLKGSAGKTWTLHEQKSKAIVVVFLATECPMCNEYLPTLAELAKTYTEKGVSVIGIVPDVEISSDRLAAHAKEYKISFPLFRDTAHVSIAALGPKSTPEVVVLDEKFIVRYRGRIDDKYSARLKARSVVTRNDLAIALDEILAMKPVSLAETKAFGCPIAAIDAKKPVAETSVTFHKDVLPILQKHCQGCHRAGQVGSFELTSYKSTVKWAELCLEEVKAKRMPPWKPSENPLLAGERTVPSESVKILEKWIAQGMPEGNLKDAPPALKFNADWMLGEPDLILESPSEMTIAAKGPDLFQVQVYPTNFSEDKYIVAMEMRPGNPRVVHHTVNFLDTVGSARKLEAKAEANRSADDPDRGPGYATKMGLGFLPNPANMLGGWAPGMLPKKLPDGVGQRLPKGADFCVQFHYHRTGKQETDRTRIGLYFAKKPVTQSFYMLPPAGLFWKIPAGDKDFKVDSSWRLMDDVTVYRLVPHMHLIGKDIELYMTPPDGKEVSLIRIPEWDYNWQEQYELKEPLKLGKGTILRVRATFDNSADNPLNPSSPPRAVMVGEQTTSEMCFVFLGIASTRSMPPLLLPARGKD